METHRTTTPARPGAGLTAGQRALLEAELTRRRHALESRLALHHGGTTRAEHAHELLHQDGDDAPQRDAERSVDLALSELETQELGAVHQALRRVHEADYGLCRDCGDAIPFDRLKVEPQALHCVACATQREGHPPTPARL
jgi:RNA polymerase-binding transcription factor DksA